MDTDTDEILKVKAEHVHSIYHVVSRVPWCIMTAREEHIVRMSLLMPIDKWCWQRWRLMLQVGLEI